jgi:hypothetical protein
MKHGVLRDKIDVQKIRILLNLGQQTKPSLHDQDSDGSNPMKNHDFLPGF